MEITLTAEPRQGTGKGVARKLRAAGKVPGVVYGAGGEATLVSIDRRVVSHALAASGSNVLIDLKIGDQTFLTLARELQRDPVRGDIKHIDFVKIERNQTIEVEVPIHVVGNAEGVKLGGMVEHHVWSVTVSCTPGNVPEFLEADISHLGLHEHFRIGELKAPEHVTILSEPETAIVTITTPQELKVEADLEQPEVVAEKGTPAEGTAEAGS